MNPQANPAKSPGRCVARYMSDTEQCKWEPGHRGPHESLNYTWPYDNEPAQSFEQKIMPGAAGELFGEIQVQLSKQAERAAMLRHLVGLLTTDPAVREFVNLKAELGL